MTVLYKAGAATQPDYDDTRAQEQSTQAAVDNANAQIAEAQLALSYCDLRAPFDSWVLKRNVDLGTLVGPATNGFIAGRHAHGEGGLRRSRHGHRRASSWAARRR